MNVSLFFIFQSNVFYVSANCPLKGTVRELAIMREQDKYATMFRYAPDRKQLSYCDQIRATLWSRANGLNYYPIADERARNHAIIASDIQTYFDNDTCPHLIIFKGDIYDLLRPLLPPNYSLENFESPLKITAGDKGNECEYHEWKRSLLPYQECALTELVALKRTVLELRTK